MATAPMKPISMRRQFFDRARASAALLALLLAAVAANAQRSVAGADFVVAVPVADMFRNPSADSDVISQAIYGTDVLSIEQHEDWDRIRTADGYTGWVQASSLKKLGVTGPYAAEGKGVHVASLSANIYDAPNIKRHAPLLRLPWEARLEIASESANAPDQWLSVRLVDGRNAWVQRGDVSAARVPLSIDETIQLARRFLGITYTWGGVSTFGFDCSGFTQMLVRQRGTEMPRDASLQAAWNGAVPVKREDLQPGDLLFFGSNPDKITHTGMYIGGGQFIHDTTHDHPGVQVSNLNDEPWTKLLVAARRVP